MSEETSEASAAKKRKLGQRFRPKYCIEFSCLMKYCNQDLSIQHGVRDEHTYTTKQLKSTKSTTYQAFQNYTLIILWEGEGWPLQEILISIDSKLKHRIHL
jgi:hypothetical protein